MKRYHGEHLLYKKSVSHETMLFVIILLVMALCLVGSISMMTRAIAVEPKYEPTEAVPELIEEGTVSGEMLGLDIWQPLPEDPEWVLLQEAMAEEASEDLEGFTDEHLEYYKGMVQWADADRIAKCLKGEYNNPSNYQQSSGVVWAVLNFVDAGYGSIQNVVNPSWFLGYSANNTYSQEQFDIVVDVMARWYAEKDGWEGHSGRTLPKEYKWFTGNHPDHCNWFRNAYNAPYDIWDWSETF